MAISSIIASDRIWVMVALLLRMDVAHNLGHASSIPVHVDTRHSRKQTKMRLVRHNDELGELHGALN